MSVTDFFLKRRRKEKKNRTVFTTIKYKTIISPGMLSPRMNTEKSLFLQERFGSTF